MDDQTDLIDAFTKYCVENNITEIHIKADNNGQLAIVRIDISIEDYQN